MTYAAILFDMDGTLLETNPLWDRATRAAVKSRDIFLTEEEHASLGGVLIHVLLGEKGYSEEEITLVKKARNDMMLTLTPAEARWKTGAEMMLASLQQSTAIVTSAPALLVDAFDEALHMRRFIDVIIDGDAVKPHYKPDPTGLLLACERLNMDPSMCVYVGDQECDLQAAKAAGMDAILVRGTHTPHTLTHSMMIDSLEELAALL